MSKYLDIEKLEYNDNIVEIDDEIAETILILNKKGYKTYACCSGHSKVEFYPYETSLENKAEILKTHDLIYEEKDKLYCVTPSTNAYVYIKFDKHYDFENLPEGFEYETSDEIYKQHQKNLKEDPDLSNNIIFGDTIGKRVYLWDYDKEEYIRPSSIIDEKIKEANKVLLEWAKELKPLKKDN